MGKQVTIIYDDNIEIVTYQAQQGKKPIIYGFASGKTYDIPKDIDIMEQFPWYNKLFVEQMHTITDYTSNFIVNATDSKSSIKMVSRSQYGYFILSVDTGTKGARTDNPKNIYTWLKRLLDKKQTEFTENDVVVKIFNCDEENVGVFYWLREIINAMERTAKELRKEDNSSLLIKDKATQTVNR